MRAKSLPLYLSADTYRRLEQAALAEDRDPIQQARWIIRRALEGAKDHPRGDLAAHEEAPGAVLGGHPERFTEEKIRVES